MTWLPPSDDAPILLVAAVPAEVRSLVNDSTSAGDRAWTIATPRPGVDVLISGIGRVNAAAATATAIATRAGRPQYRAIVNIGVAGALPKRPLNIGDVVVASRCVFVEEGIALPDGPRDMTGLGFELVDNVAWASGNTITPNADVVDELMDRLGTHASTEVIATVARCSGTDPAANEVVALTGAFAEAMEGAAVVMTAQRLGVPGAEVRVISNTCGDREHQHWDLSAALMRLDSIIGALTSP